MIVQNEKTNEILFKSEDAFECVKFVHNNYDENHPDWGYIWIKED